MKIYTVITQSINNVGHHQNSIDNFSNFEDAKKYINDCVEGNKKLEGEDTFSCFEMTGSWTEYGWMFNNRIPYGVEMKRNGECKDC